MIGYKLRLYLATEPWPKETAQVSVITGLGTRIFTLIRSKKDPLLLKESLICRRFRADAVLDQAKAWEQQREPVPTSSSSPKA